MTQLSERFNVPEQATDTPNHDIDLIQNLSTRIDNLLDRIDAIEDRLIAMLVSDKTHKDRDADLKHLILEMRRERIKTYTTLEGIPF